MQKFKNSDNILLFRVAEVLRGQFPDLNYTVMLPNSFGSSSSALRSPFVFHRSFKATRYHYLCCLVVASLVAGLVPEFSEAQRTYRLSGDHYKTIDKKVSVKTDSRFIQLGINTHQSMASEFMYQGRESLIQPMIDVMESYMDSLQWITAYTGEPLPAKGKPFLYVGSAESETAPFEAHMMREANDTYAPMVLHLDKPSKSWRETYREYTAGQEADFAIVIWLGFSEYPKTEKGLFKKKVVLGTGYEREIRFLSDIDKPVEVLQLSAVMLNHEGEVVRAGAEAFLHQDTPFWAQMLDVKQLTDDNTMQAVLNHTREDLPGEPLAWKVALHHLLQQLTRRPVNYSAMN